MRLIRCRKCGTTVTTDESLLENMIEQMNDCNENARNHKDRSARNSYIQQASQISKFISQIQHRTTELERRKIIKEYKLSGLSRYLKENNIMTQEEINEIYDIEEKKALIKNKNDEDDIKKLFGSYRNSMVNRTNRDSTANIAINNMAKK